MSHGTLLSDVHIKEEPPCEEHDAAAPRVRESQIKPEPSECSDMQLKLEPTDQEIQVELVEVEPYCEEQGASATGGAADQCSNMELAQERAGQGDSLYPGHVVKEEMVIGPVEVWQQPPPLMYIESTNALEPMLHQCSNRSDKSSSSVNHKKTKHATHKQVSCDTCDKNFKFKSTLLRHQKIHLTTEKRFKCDVCGKKFTHKYYVKAHLLHVHSGVKPFECDICKKQFPDKTRIRNHLRVHSGEKPYECDICSKKFSERSLLRNHLFVHCGEKPFTCPICDKKFGLKSRLTIHISTHSVQKYFKCYICDVKFTQRSTFTTHLRVHIGEKLFRCAICDKKFTRMSSLTTHLGVHRLEKKQLKREIVDNNFIQIPNPYECKKLAKEGPLTHHLGLHGGEKLFECNICNNKFAQISELSAHIRVHQNV